MAFVFTPSPLLGQTFPLGDGIRVRLRLAHFSDRAAIADLLNRQGPQGAPNPRIAERLVQFDPRRRYVVCACALIDSTERLAGVGAIDLDPAAATEPDLLVIDEELAGARDPQFSEALTGLLWGALVGAAQASARARAA